MPEYCMPCVELDIAGARHCHVKECRQLDFLPLQCKACHNYYCKECFKAHNCPKASEHDRRVVICPLCKDSIAVTGEDMKELLNRHCATSCTRKPKPKLAKCPVEGCKEK